MMICNLCGVKNGYSDYSVAINNLCVGCGQKHEDWSYSDEEGDSEKGGGKCI